jgi:hypothetical protein
MEGVGEGNFRGEVKAAEGGGWRPLHIPVFKLSGWEHRESGA